MLMVRNFKHVCLPALAGLFASVCAVAAPDDPPDDSATREAIARVRADEARRIEALARAAKTVVCVFDDEKRGGGGSGVVISADGYALTNVHVVASFLETRRGFGGLSDGVLYPLEVIGIDPGGDIALVKLSGKDLFDFSPLADSDRIVAGEWVAAMGNPFLVADDMTPTITLGVVSGLHRYQGGSENALEYADCIQVSTSINPGNSGGPLFNLRSEVLGINGRASFEERGRVNVGVGYAVSMNQIRRFLPALRAGRLCEHGTLGATVRAEEGRLVFNAIQDLAAADRAGAQLGDELLTLNGRRVRTANEYNNALALLPSDWPVVLGVRREDKELTLRTRLDRLPVKQNAPWLIDWKRNHAYARELFARGRSRLGAADDQRPVVLRGFWTAAGASPTAREPFEFRWRDGVPDILRLAGGAERRIVDITPVGATATREPAGVLALFAHGATKMLAKPPIGIGWEVRGGDDVGGRLAVVVEARPQNTNSTTPTLRWKFDEAHGDLLQVVRMADAVTEIDDWTPMREESRTALLPRMWRFADGSTLEIDALEMEKVAAAAEEASQ